LQNYFLFIDTETSGLPKNWKAPYHQEKNWPYIIQIAWIVYDQNLNEIERQNHFIKNSDFEIEKSSQKIHHITADDLQLYGKSRETAMMAFYQDVKKYRPIVIGHFMEFDYHMINVEFQRIGMTDVLAKLPLFCTMKASKPYVKNPDVELLKLNDFYFELFNEKPKHFHNALSDALNTAKIFFHLLKNGEITENSLNQQENDFSLTNGRLNTDLSPTKKFINRLFSF